MGCFLSGDRGRGLATPPALPSRSSQTGHGYIIMKILETKNSKKKPMELSLIIKDFEFLWFHFVNKECRVQFLFIDALLAHNIRHL